MLMSTPAWAWRFLSSGVSVWWVQACSENRVWSHVLLACLGDSFVSVRAMIWGALSPDKMEVTRFWEPYRPRMLRVPMDRVGSL